MKRPLPPLSRSTFRRLEKMWRNNNDVSPLGVSTAIEMLLQISELDNRCIHIIILWKYGIYYANVGPYNTVGVHCQCPVCGLSKQGINRGGRCRIMHFAVMGNTV